MCRFWHENAFKYLHLFISLSKEFHVRFLQNHKFQKIIWCEILRYKNQIVTRHLLVGKVSKVF